MTNLTDLRAWLSFQDGDDPIFQTIYALLAERETLREALAEAADTFADLATALKLLGHTTSAEACEIAEVHTRAALKGDKP